MAVVHIAVLWAALSALLVLPCAAAALLALDARLLRRMLTRRGCRQSQSLNSALRLLDVDARLAALDDPAIEQIANDLRRLDHQRRSDLTRSSKVWLAAVQSAYDIRLQIACRQLGVDEHLQPLNGVDREIERLRVEDQLEAAGLTLRCRGSDGPR